ncbi:MAG TPA: translation elongation factor 4 [Bacilli bacterium]|nr:MAG: Elongation factor 4 [Tenericutes bacterium ADurb.BinA124]HNZ50897.1 translation elongation factor 4 [Bacilli bacterium]HPX84577.1 translation elongation factor 4 [Bacilli bacterium]
MNIKQNDLNERQKFIRNFSIIAHIDHGKSTLADRILELTHTVEARLMKEQLLDSMDIERERGITIKLNAVEIVYQALDGHRYILHLIDTPGHVDFTYEVSRSLAACEGAILVVDAVQGIEAQTLANVYLAIDNNLEIIPVINKIDLPNANPEFVKKEIENVIGLDAKDALLVSAKQGLGIREVLESIVKKVPCPQGDPHAPLQALIFDSYYDQYRGIVPSIRIINGTVRKGDKIISMANGVEFEVTEVGVYTPNEVKREFLSVGDVGYLAASIKDINLVRVGDTITGKHKPAAKPLPGYRHLNPMVFCGMFPIDNTKFGELKEALEKLKLNDAALIFEPESSQALGSGFRVGFLGLLHMDIVQERLEREFNLDLIATAPSVSYRVNLENGRTIMIDNPSLMPEPNFIKSIEEPYVLTTIMSPAEYIGPIMEICQNKRAIFKSMKYIEATRVTLEYEMPLSEIIYDFFNRLKSATKGYASFDYQLSNYLSSKLVRMDILLNGEKVDALSLIVHKDTAFRRGKAITDKLKELLPRQMFEVPIQAALGSKIIARSTLKALRKNVLAKCYGGDISRKKKLLQKQKEGKKRMKTIGSVEVPQTAFLAVLSIDDDQ